jgi:hypothetical protein
MTEEREDMEVQDLPIVRVEFFHGTWRRQT